MNIKELSVIKELNAITKSFPDSAICAVWLCVKCYCERHDFSLKGISFYTETESIRMYTDKGIPCPTMRENIWDNESTNIDPLGDTKKISEHTNDENNTTIRIYRNMDKTSIMLELVVNNDMSQYLRVLMKKDKGGDL